MIGPFAGVSLGTGPFPSDFDVSDAALPGWLVIALALAVLVAAAAEARFQLGRSEQIGPPSRIVRIILPAAVLAGVSTLFLVVEFVLRGGKLVDLALLAPVAAAIFMLIFLVVVAVLDFWFGLFEPRRNPISLALALGGFVLLVAAALILSFWLAGALEQLLRVKTLQWLAAAAAAAITWWSRLPPAGTGVERRFE